MRSINVGGRQGRGDPVRGESVDTTESTKGLFTSKWFWLLGLACVLIWSGLWDLCVAWLRHH